MDDLQLETLRTPFDVIRIVDEVEAGPVSPAHWLADLTHDFRGGVKLHIDGGKNKKSRKNKNK